MTSNLELTLLSMVLRHPRVLTTSEMSPTVRDIMETAGTIVAGPSGEILVTETGRQVLRAAGLLV